MAANLPPRDANPYRFALHRLRGSFLAVGFLSAIINLLMLTGPLYMLQVYDRVLSSGSLATLQALFLIVVVLYAFMGGYEFLRSRLLARAAVRLDMALGEEAFGGWLRNRDQNVQPLQDLGAVRSFISSPAMGSIFDVPWIPLYLGLLFVIHPWLGWLTLGGAGIVALAAIINRKATQAPQERAARLEERARSFAGQTVRNAELVGALGMDGRVAARWQEIHGSALAEGQAASNVTEVTSAFSKSFRLLLQSAMLTLGAFLVLRHEMTAGMIIASSILSGRALAPVDQIIAQWRLIGGASLANQRLRAFFDEAPSHRRQTSLPALTGRVEVSRLLCLAPGSAGKERAKILNNVGFELSAGDGLGVIGNSAAGKSTLARVLVGACLPESGEVRFDGATPAQWAPEQLGRSIGYLPQTVELLPGTVRDNITRFDSAARDEDMFEAARMAGVHEMILSLPEGYETQVGYPGQPLSGGQVQRLGLVRAIFGAPRLIVLDEPNSNLDAAGEAALARVISTLRAKGSTVILMTHRTSALAEMNKILLLNSGNVIRYGERDEVLRTLMRPVEDPPRNPAPIASTSVDKLAAARSSILRAEAEQAVGGQS